MEPLNLEQIILKIKNNYYEFLTEEDCQILISNPKESDIRKIVNKIWNNYLSNPFDYTEDNFKFLVNKNGMLSIDSFEPDKYPLFHEENLYLEILTSEKVLNETNSAGFIVNVDWDKTDKIYLPDDFNQGKEIKINPSLLAVFNINSGLGKVDSLYHVSQIISEELDLLFISFNKLKLNQSYQFTKDNEDNIVRGIVSYYLLDKDLTNLDLHQSLRKTYRNYILNSFKFLVKENIYNDDAFIKEISDYIDAKENVIKRSK
ncbi:MAG: hypothetical protein PHG03_06220 [Bacilli bacterium]|nr:hypothetical protein [Bacilli bacterium]